MNIQINKEKFLNDILTSMDDAIVLVDTNLNVKYLNRSAKRIWDQADGSFEGKHMFNELKFWEIPTKRNKVQEVIEKGNSIKGVIRKLHNDRQLSITIAPLVEEGQRSGALIVAQDITESLEMQNELDMAFALTLPNSKVEQKLKSTVEYQDSYDPETKKITIKGIIQDGGYRHVVNCLKLLGQLHQLGITNLIGIDKDLMVKALIFHDLGKSQPELKIGEVVDPKEVFEDGKLHAYRGAEIAKHFYDFEDDIVEIIRHHHHSEKELPESFTWRLLPMFRLFQLIDGLSAALTRGSAKLSFSVSDTVITVNEENSRPHFNKKFQIDLFTGTKKSLS